MERMKEGTASEDSAGTNDFEMFDSLTSYDRVGL
jgi:hypothetical protein